KRRLADTISIGLSGAINYVNKIADFASKSGKGDSTIWGTDLKTNVASASIANGTMTFHMELDDVHRSSHTHPGISVIPVALAVCEDYNLNGKQLFKAIAPGYDLVLKLENQSVLRYTFFVLIKFLLPLVFLVQLPQLVNFLI